MTTITAFVSSIGGLTVSGVTRSETYRPKSIYSADLPFQFVELPDAGRDESFITTCSGSGKTRAIELVVCLKEIDRDKPEPNYAATVTMMDALETALDTFESSSSMMIDYEISAGGRAVGDAFYWAATATVTGTDV